MGSAIPVDEARLIEQAREGSEDAFTELLRLHQGRVRSFLGRFVRARDVVDDLAQETFLTAYRSLETYKGESPLAHWLLGIARHRILTHLRDEELRRRHETGGLASFLAGWKADRIESEVSPPSEHERKLSALETCLKGLPESSANLVQAWYYRNASSTEIARELGKSESAVRMTLLRIRLSLRHCIRTRLSGMEANP